MKKDIDISPEKIELERYRNMVKLYASDLESRKEVLSKLIKEIETFEEFFTKTIGKRYEKLREIDYEMEKYTKKDEELKIKVEAEYSKFKEYSVPARNIEILEDRNNSIKELYKEIVKEIHPDRSSDENERRIKTDILKEINIAYEEGNKDKMMVIYNKWKYNPESINLNTVGEELIFAIRTMYTLQKDLSEIDSDINEISSSDIYILKKEVDRYKGTNRNPIKDICVSLDKEIQNKRQLLRFLQLLEEKSNMGNKVRNRKV